VRVRVALGSALAALTFAFPCLANGRFPSANQLVVDPLKPNHIVARSTFGLLITQDTSRWDWVCEKAVGFGDYEDPSISLLKDGTLIAGTTKGLAEAPRDACAWGFASDIGPTQVADVSRERNDPSHALALTSVTMDGIVFTTRVWTSTDSGKTWANVG